VPTEVSRKAPAILSILQAQQAGITPSIMADVLQPVIDIGELYMLDLWEEDSGSIAISAGDTGPNMTTIAVPDGEIWRIHNHTVEVAHQLTGELTVIVPCFQVRSNLTFTPQLVQTSGLPTPLRANRQLASATNYWAHAGTDFGFWTIMCDRPAGTVVCTTNLLFTRFGTS